MLDVLDSEYIKLARIKGLPERVVIWKHALRNALLTPLTVAGLIFAMMITGAVITEQVFNWPGLGRLILDATMARDFPVVQAITIITAVFVLGINQLLTLTLTRRSDTRSLKGLNHVQYHSENRRKAREEIHRRPFA
jgi:peptide/nickel transport system permease protein